MRLDKYAPWGLLARSTGDSPLGPQSLRQRIADLAEPLRSNANLGQRIDALATAQTQAMQTLAQQIASSSQTTSTALAGIKQSIESTSGSNAGGVPTVEGTPSLAAFLIIWCLNGVRDALCDQSDPNFDSTNAQIEAHEDDANVRACKAWLVKKYSILAEQFAAQFHVLYDKQQFEPERRLRLANLMAFERRVLAQVHDNESPIGGTAKAKAKAKPRKQA